MSRNVTNPPKSRSWCWTWNNYPKAPYDSYCQTWGNVKYWCYGLEVGESGTPHLQGYVDFGSPRSLSGLKKLNPQIHWEMRKGTWDQAVDYCKKGGTWYQGGTPFEQGKRYDLLQVKDKIMKGELTAEAILLDQPETYHKHGRTIEKLQALKNRTIKRVDMTQGYYIHGGTGTGKSHLAFSMAHEFGSYYVLNTDDNGWWEGYTGQDTVIIDDFRGEIKYNQLLRLCDKYEMTVKQRGKDPMPFTSKYIIVTSSLAPELVYRQQNMKEDKIDQLLRRFQVIKLEQKWSGNTVTDHCSDRASICPSAGRGDISNTDTNDDEELDTAEWLLMGK